MVIPAPPAGEAELPRGRVLVIEPDQAWASTVAAMLEGRGYALRVTGTAAEAKAVLPEVQPHVVLLELALPDSDGLVLCAHLKQHSQAAIVVCTTQNSRRERMLAYRLGAEDFISKPVDDEELEVRVGAVVRRAREREALLHAAAAFSEDATSVGGVTLGRSFPSASVNGQNLPLTPAEHRILSHLMRHANKVVAREEMARAALGYPYVAGTRALDMHVRRLRAKLRAAGATALQIVPVRGQGYKLVGEVRRTILPAA